MAAIVRSRRQRAEMKTVETIAGICFPLVFILLGWAVSKFYFDVADNPDAPWWSMAVVVLGLVLLLFLILLVPILYSD